MCVKYYNMVRYTTQMPSLTVGKHTLAPALVARIIADIKQTRYPVDDALVRSGLARALPEHRRVLARLAEGMPDARIRRSEDYKALIKSVRSRLRRKVGMFVRGNATSGLLSHASARERSAHYDLLYKKIFAITGKPRRILDLACGLNPLSVAHMNLARVDYEAWDVAKPLVDEVDEFFAKAKHHGVRGVARVIDVHRLAKEDLFADTPHADVCFLFKALDSLEPAKGHKFAELLLSRVPARWIAATFSTKTIGGRPMRHPYRGWMDRMLTRRGWRFTEFEVGDEIVYIIDKENNNI